MAQNNNIKPSEISQVLLQQLKDIDTSLHFEEIGKVLQVSDGVARMYGLTNAEAGELLEFESGVMGVVMNLEQDNVGAVLLGPTDEVKEGMTVRRTKRIASIKVGESMLGRVVDPLGVPLDGLGNIDGELTEMPLERKAPGVVYRQPVTEPLQTGLKAIDAMIPIGRGQRELIIGDRQTGKTAIAIDTIINQRSCYQAGKPVYCIYVAVGQKGSTVANIVETLRAKGAMDYTIVVAATAADPAALQYFAPFAGAAIGEYFRDTGRPALVVYDDLSKQAVAYREVSLILHRPSGREAYPGDVFYLHSRLLERAAKIIDQQIYQNYHLFATNYIAYDYLGHCQEFAEYYTPKQKEEFLQYIEKQSIVEDVAADKMKSYLLQIYVNPVKTHYGKELNHKEDNDW